MFHWFSKTRKREVGISMPKTEKETEKFEITKEQVNFKLGSISFPGYQELKESAERLKQRVQTIEVTEDNVKESKKLRAAVNNQVKAINDERIRISKAMKAPVMEFEGQVKEITNIAKDASDGINEQIRELEEREREQKRNSVIELFNKHAGMYEGFPLTAEQFLADKTTVLNKSTTMTKAELMIATWLDTHNSELQTIANMSDSEVIMAKYLNNGQDLANAIQAVADDKKRKQEAIQAVREVNNETTTSTKIITIFKIVDEDQANQVEKLLQDNHITYSKEITY